MQCVMGILNQFSIMSGQEVSEEKTSRIFSNNVARSVRNKLLNISKFRETQDLGKYLGVLFSGKRLRRGDYQYLLEQMSRKMASWKTNSFSFAGRNTLAKSVLEVMPIYPMMTNNLPKTCIEEIHILERNFIRGDTEIKKRHHAVRWDDISQQKKDGGLGL